MRAAASRSPRSASAASTADVHTPLFDSTTQAKSSVLIRPGPSSASAAATMSGDDGARDRSSPPTSMSSSSAPTDHGELSPQRASTPGLWRSPPLSALGGSATVGSEWPPQGPGMGG